VGNLKQGYELLLQFEEPLKEYVGMVQNIKVNFGIFTSFQVQVAILLDGLVF
jgi:hypothetical protein